MFQSLFAAEPVVRIHLQTPDNEVNEILVGAKFLHLFSEVEVHLRHQHFGGSIPHHRLLHRYQLAPALGGYPLELGSGIDAERVFPLDSHLCGQILSLIREAEEHPSRQ